MPRPSALLSVAALRENDSILVHSPPISAANIAKTERTASRETSGKTTHRLIASAQQPQQQQREPRSPSETKLGENDASALAFWSDAGFPLSTIADKPGNLSERSMDLVPQIEAPVATLRGIDCESPSLERTSPATTGVRSESLQLSGKPVAAICSNSLASEAAAMLQLQRKLSTSRSSSSGNETPLNNDRHHSSNSSSSDDEPKSFGYSCSPSNSMNIFGAVTRAKTSGRTPPSIEFRDKQSEPSPNLCVAIGSKSKAELTRSASEFDVGELSRGVYVQHLLDRGLLGEQWRLFANLPTTLKTEKTVCVGGVLVRDNWIDCLFTRGKYIDIRAWIRASLKKLNALKSDKKSLMHEGKFLDVTFVEGPPSSQDRGTADWPRSLHSLITEMKRGEYGDPDDLFEAELESNGSVQVDLASDAVIMSAEVGQKTADIVAVAQFSAHDESMSEPEYRADEAFVTSHVNISSDDDGGLFSNSDSKKDEFCDEQLQASSVHDSLVGRAAHVPVFSHELWSVEHGICAAAEAIAAQGQPNGPTYSQSSMPPLEPAVNSPRESSPLSSKPVNKRASPSSLAHAALRPSPGGEWLSTTAPSVIMDKRRRLSQRRRADLPEANERRSTNTGEDPTPLVTRKVLGVRPEPPVRTCDDWVTPIHRDRHGFAVSDQRDELDKDEPHPSGDISFERSRRTQLTLRKFTTPRLSACSSYVPRQSMVDRNAKQATQMLAPRTLGSTKQATFRRQGSLDGPKTPGANRVQPPGDSALNQADPSPVFGLTARRVSFREDDASPSSIETRSYSSISPALQQPVSTALSPAIVLQPAEGAREPFVDASASSRLPPGTSERCLPTRVRLAVGRNVSTLRMKAEVVRDCLLDFCAVRAQGATSANYPQDIALCTTDSAPPTHVVVNTTPDRRARRTLTYMKALACGVWILTSDFIDVMLVSQQWPCESDFEVTGDQTITEPQDVPRKARLERAKPNSRALLANFRVHVHGTMRTNLSMCEMIELLSAAGATVVDADTAVADAEVVVLADKTILADRQARFSAHLLFGRYTTDVDWLFDSLSHYAVREVADYALRLEGAPMPLEDSMAL